MAGGAITLGLLLHDLTLPVTAHWQNVQQND
jgi:hypothetical protein